MCYKMQQTLVLARDPNHRGPFARLQRVAQEQDQLELGDFIAIFAINFREKNDQLEKEEIFTAMVKITETAKVQFCHEGKKYNLSDGICGSNPTFDIL